MGLSPIQVLRQGGWKTDEDLAKITGRERFEVNFEASKSRQALTVSPYSIGVLAPLLRGSTYIYHMAPPALRALAESGGDIYFTDLPLSLKLSLLKVLEQRHRKRSRAQWWIPMWMRAELALEKHLAAMNLCSPRPRPDDGFYFPCFWHARGVGHQWGRWQQNNPFQFQVAFTETLDTNAGKTLTPRLNGRPPISSTIAIEPHGQVTFNENSTTVRLTGIVEGRVNKRTLKVTGHPTRGRIIDATKRLLLFYSQDDGPAAPFVPLERARFELLGKTAEPRTR